MKKNQFFKKCVVQPKDSDALKAQLNATLLKQELQLKKLREKHEKEQEALAVSLGEILHVSFYRNISQIHVS